MAKVSKAGTLKAPAHLAAPTRAWWEQWKVKGTDLQIMGPWPERGLYWTFAEGIDIGTKLITYSTFEKAPPFDWMERAIAQFEYNRGKADKIADQNFRMLAALSEMRDRKAAQERKRIQVVKKLLDDTTRPLWGSSLAAGRAREHLAARIRARTGQSMGHVGN